MRRKALRVVILIVISILILLPLYTPCAAEDEFSPALTSGNAVVVYNIESGQTLYANKGDDAVAPTVATKLLAMMVVYDLFAQKGINAETQMITVSAESLTNIGALGDKSAPKLDLTSGDRFTAKDLISAALVANANDACSALAYYCSTELLGGDIESFVALMNQKATEIGTTNSFFKNATGLDQNGMVTTPKDVALIAAAFYKYNDLLVICNQATILFNGDNTVHTKNYLISDKLISDFKLSEAIGMIAGQRSDTEDYTLITAVEKDGLTYIIVVMEATGEIRDTAGIRSFTAGNAYYDVKLLIDWTLVSFGYQTLVGEGEQVSELRVDLGKDYDYVSIVPEKKVERLVNNGVDVALVERTITYNSEIVYKGEYNAAVVDMVNAPISKGQIVGIMVFSYNGSEIGRVNLVAQSTVDSSGLLSTAKKVKGFLFGGTMRFILIAFGVIVVLYILFSITTAVIRSVNKIKKIARNRQIKHENENNKHE